MTPFPSSAFLFWPDLNGYYNFYFDPGAFQSLGAHQSIIVNQLGHPDSGADAGAIVVRAAPRTARNSLLRGQAVEQEVAPAVRFGFHLRRHVDPHILQRAAFVHHGPLRKTRAIRISGLDEVRKVALHNG